MVWPSILSTVALFLSFHGQVKAGMPSRLGYFAMATSVVFIYSWFPSYFLVALQSVSVICFLTRNRTLSFLASASNGYGVGLGAITFDLSYIGGGYLTTPFWATLNLIFGKMFWGWILTPILYYSNVFGVDSHLSKENYSDGSPIGCLNSPSLFNSTLNHISPISLYLKPNYDLNIAEYEKQSPIYITTFFACISLV